MSDPLLPQTAGGFQEWWEKQCFDVSWFKPMRKCWFAAQCTQLRALKVNPKKQRRKGNE